MTISIIHNRVLIIGATSSLAQEICRVLAKRGGELILTGRDKTELSLLANDLSVRSNIFCSVVMADLNDANFSPEKFIAQAGDFDNAIIAVGDMGSGNNDDLENIAAVTRLNFTLPAQLATVIAAKFSEKHSGTVTIISSIAGDRGRKHYVAYGGAKAALSAFSSGLRARYAKENVHVMTVKPGFVDTPMTWGMHSKLIASRSYVAKKIVRAMDKKKNVIYVPFFWRNIMFMVRIIPESIFKRLSI